jgi:hypothetical protein
MAINRLQIRRDSLADFQTAALSPEGGEPQYIVEEKRIRIGDAKGTHVSRQQLVAPTVEGSQFHGLWNIRSFGTGKCIDVPVSNGAYLGGDGTYTAPYYVASAALPNGALRDAGIAHISASGDFLPGSTDPAMVFGFELGKAEGSVAGNKTVLSPRAGGHPSGAADPDKSVGGIHISTVTGYKNCLGDYNKPVTWDLEAKVCFLGKDSISPFKTSQGEDTSTFTFRDKSEYQDNIQAADPDNANVRVYGTLIIQDSFDNYANSRSYISQDIQQTGFGGAFGTPNKNNIPTNTPSEHATMHERGDVRVCNGTAWEAMGDVPVENWSAIGDLPGGTVADVNTKIRRLCNAMVLNGNSEPGAGRHGYRWWRPKKTVVQFSFEEFVENFDEDDLMLHFKVGGPMQSDPGVVYPELEAGLNRTSNDNDYKGLYVAGEVFSDKAVLFAAAHRGGVNHARYDQDNSAAFTDSDELGASSGAGNQRVGRSINGNDYACRTAHKWGAAQRYNTDPDLNLLETTNTSAAQWYYELPTKKTVNLTTGDGGDTWAYDTGTDVLSIGEEPSVSWVTDQFVVGERVQFEINNNSVQGTGFVASGSTDSVIQIENITWGLSGEPADTVTSARTAAAGFVETPAADADGEWNCAWRRLPADRRDRMRIHHTTAFFFGGRPGINDYRSV